MGLLDEFKNEPSRPGVVCRIQVVKETMTPDDVTELDDALADRTITGAAIERVLARRGIRVQQNTITRHRRGECTCGK